MLQSEDGHVGERLRVFVAEGSALDLFWLEMVFKSSRIPYTIEVATNGEAAKHYLEQHQPDLVFVDAFETLQQLPTGKAPLFMLTNSSSPDEREQFRSYFGTDPEQRCIEKPFTRQKLSDCLVAADLNAWATRLSGDTPSA
jgi:CheY-like chemotaxis protein